MILYGPVKSWRGREREREILRVDHPSANIIIITYKVTSPLR